MSTISLEVKNEVHGTYSTVNADLAPDGVYRISELQFKAAKGRLCVKSLFDGCDCGGVNPMRAWDGRDSYTIERKEKPGAVYYLLACEVRIRVRT